mgnify:CR=1 FL=1
MGAADGAATARSGLGGWLPFVSNGLLFLLVSNLAATVDLSLVRSRGRGLVRGLLVAVLCQFVLLPLVGFLTARAFQLEDIEAIMLQVVVSSPGGAYSNWWCSLLNADLVLSVGATTLSTVCSAGLLPLNLFIYLGQRGGGGGGGSLLHALHWDLLLVSIGVVTAAVGCGTLVTWQIGKRSARPSVAAARRRWFGCVGNAAGLCLIAFSFVFSSTNDPIWDKSAKFYAAVTTPALLALGLALSLASLPCVRLAPPERVAITIECLYQNTGIGLSIALSVFSGDDASRAHLPMTLLTL